MKIVIYGIRNCDTMKKAFAWLTSREITFDFHDYKVRPIEKSQLVAWVKKVGWEVLLNRAGTTFRKLPEEDRTSLTEAKAIRLMLEQPSMIKRPVVECGATLLVGFSPEKYAALPPARAAK